MDLSVQEFGVLENDLLLDISDFEDDSSMESIAYLLSHGTGTDMTIDDEQFFSQSPDQFDLTDMGFNDADNPLLDHSDFFFGDDLELDPSMALTELGFEEMDLFDIVNDVLKTSTIDMDGFIQSDENLNIVFGEPNVNLLDFIYTEEAKEDVVFKPAELFVLSKNDSPGPRVRRLQPHMTSVSEWTAKEEKSKSADVGSNSKENKVSFSRVPKENGKNKIKRSKLPDESKKAERERAMMEKAKELAKAIECGNIVAKPASFQDGKGKLQACKKPIISVQQDYAARNSKPISFKKVISEMNEVPNKKSSINVPPASFKKSPVHEKEQKPKKFKHLIQKGTSLLDTSRLKSNTGTVVSGKSLLANVRTGLPIDNCEIKAESLKVEHGSRVGRSLHRAEDVVMAQTPIHVKLEKSAIAVNSLSSNISQSVAVMSTNNNQQAIVQHQDDKQLSMKRHSSSEEFAIKQHPNMQQLMNVQKSPKKQQLKNEQQPQIMQQLQNVQQLQNAQQSQQNMQQLENVQQSQQDMKKLENAQQLQNNDKENNKKKISLLDYKKIRQLNNNKTNDDSRSPPSQVKTENKMMNNDHNYCISENKPTEEQKTLTASTSAKMMDNNNNNNNYYNNANGSNIKVASIGNPADQLSVDLTRNKDMNKEPNENYFKKRKISQESSYSPRKRCSILKSIWDDDAKPMTNEHSDLPAKKTCHYSNSAGYPSDASSSTSSRKSQRGSSIRSTSSSSSEDYDYTRSRRRSRSRSSRCKSGRNRTSSRTEVEQQKAKEERRIVYVGGIPSDYTSYDLERKLQTFGNITKTTVHTNDDGEHYGFVTFEKTDAAASAKQGGNRLPGFENFYFSYGGRRAFCETRYADLDYESVRRGSASKKDSKSNDFNDLLKQAMSMVQKSKRKS